MFKMRMVYVTSKKNTSMSKKHKKFKIKKEIGQFNCYIINILPKTT